MQTAIEVTALTVMAWAVLSYLAWRYWRWEQRREREVWSPWARPSSVADELLLRQRKAMDDMIIALHTLQRPSEQLLRAFQEVGVALGKVRFDKDERGSGQVAVPVVLAATLAAAALLSWAVGPIVGVAFLVLVASSINLGYEWGRRR